MRQALLVLLLFTANAIGSVVAAGQNPATPTATVTGVVRDWQGARLPGVTISATGDVSETRTATDAEGGYRLILPAGSHTVRATLLGFCRAEATIERGAGGAVTVDFELQPGPQLEIDWIVRSDTLADLVADANTIALVRVIESAEPQECQALTRVRATIIEQVKPAGTPPATITFWQERWPSEPKPYPVGTELVVSLIERKGRFVRIYGPHADFVVMNGKILRSSLYPHYRRYQGMAVEDLLREMSAAMQGR